eukprot:scaffold1320_cov253-Pinguiococcus_pyrenoidosus.AAC.12
MAQSPESCKAGLFGAPHARGGGAGASGSRSSELSSPTLARLEGAWRVRGGCVDGAWMAQERRKRATGHAIT